MGKNEAVEHDVAEQVLKTVEKLLSPPPVRKSMHQSALKSFMQFQVVNQLVH